MRFVGEVKGGIEMSLFRFREPDGSLNMENPMLVPIMISVALFAIVVIGEILSRVF